MAHSRRTETVRLVSRPAWMPFLDTSQASLFDVANLRRPPSLHRRTISAACRLLTQTESQITRLLDRRLRSGDTRASRVSWGWQ
jgi:hypothetical protein